MKVIMPTGMTHGWGVAGHYLLQEIAKLPPVNNVTLQSVGGADFFPLVDNQESIYNIGYCFFEDDIEAYRYIPKIENKWDVMVAGSTWCENHLKMGGMQRTATILQGVDQTVFKQQPEFEDKSKFIVFSGGKFEYRKGQDLVIAAMKIFMDRHDDVWLAAAWFNSWVESVRTMQQSDKITFKYMEIPCLDLIEETMANNGLDMNRVILYPRTENSAMADVYRKSHIGLFPNRCEGGNNMVMCEYMACGRTVIASNRTGHADIITNGNSFPLMQYEPVIAKNNGRERGVWFEADVQEIVNLLETAYFNRNIVSQKAEAAAKDMLKLSWGDAAAKFHDIASNLVKNAKMMLPVHDISQQLIDNANEYFRAGNYQEAENIYNALITDFPFDPDLHNSLATVLDAQQRYQEAILRYNKAISLRPDFSIARYNLANTLKRIGNLIECKANLLYLTEHDPSFQPAWQNLASIYFDDGNLKESARCLEHILTISPDWILARADLGNVYSKMGGDESEEKAIACYDQIIANKPDYAAAYNSKGLILLEQGDCEGAEKCYRASIALVDNDYFVMSNLGLSLLAQNKALEAIEWFNKALELEIGSPTTRFNRALALLTLGDYKNGWEDYECRFEKIGPVYLAPINLPNWNGEPIYRQRIIVRMEQGFGDCIQCMRFLPVLKERGCFIILECIDDSIKSIFSGIDCIDSFYIRGEPVPPAEYQVPLFSLPRIFDIGTENIPSPNGYLQINQSLMDYWNSLITMRTKPGTHKIGLVWGGRKTRLNANRSLKLQDMDSIISLPEISWLSLQVGTDAEQLEGYQDNIIRLDDELITFADTAAAIKNLDLVITIDTSVAHLCGALGAPAWIMLKSSPDWRWREENGNTIWYSSLKQFRQLKLNDWNTVLIAIENELINFISKKAKVTSNSCR